MSIEEAPFAPETLESFYRVAGISALTPELVRRQRPDASALLVDEGKSVARLSAWWQRTPTLEGKAVGYLGHYGASDDRAADAILAWGCRRLAAEGCRLAVAPIDGSTWGRYRLLTERGTEPLFLLEPDNGDEEPGRFSSAGFAPLADYYSARTDDPSARDPRAARAAARLAGRGVKIRSLRMEDLADELRAIHSACLAAFAKNFLYTPIGADEFLSQYLPLAAHLRPELLLTAEAQGRTVGFLFAAPDLAQARRGEVVDAVVLKTLAVRPEYLGTGLGGVLLDAGHAAGCALGYRSAVHALMHEDNASRRLSGRTARTIRRYTLYSKPLGGS